MGTMILENEILKNKRRMPRRKKTEELYLEVWLRSRKCSSCVCWWRGRLHLHSISPFFMCCVEKKQRQPVAVPAERKHVGGCVCVFSSHSFWTSSSLDVPAGVTQEEGHTGFLIHLLSAVRALIFLARRIQPFLSLVDREVEFCVLTI